MSFDGPVTPDLLKQLQQGTDLYAMGYVPSGPRATDYLVAPSAELPQAAPARFAHPSYRQIPVRNQQGGTCVANSLSTCMTMLEFVEQGGEIVNFDAEAWSARDVGKNFGPGAAASPWALLKDAFDHGVPSTVNNVQGMYYPKAYAWLDHKDPEAVRAAISTPGQVVTGAVWLLQNFGADNGKTYIEDNPGENPWGLHEITYPAYDEHGLIFQNSWSTWWGDGGFGRMSWDYLAKRTTEMLVVTDQADNAGGFIKTFDWGSEPETAIARYDLPDRKRPAVYLVKNNGRIWIKDPMEAKRFGVQLPPVRVPDTDSRWALPVIGPDAPRNLR